MEVAGIILGVLGAVVAIVCGWRAMRAEARDNAAWLSRYRAAANPQPGAYGHPFDPVAELKKELPSPPPGHMWELTVDRSAEYCHVMTLGLLNTATGKLVASTSVNLTKNGNQEWRALYAGPGAAAWARGVIVDRTVEWALRQKEIHTPPDGPSHYEVIA